MVILLDMNIIFQLDRFKSPSHYLYLRMLLLSSIYIFTLTGILLIFIIPSAPESLHTNIMSLTISFSPNWQSEQKQGRNETFSKFRVSYLGFETEADTSNYAR